MSKAKKASPPPCSAGVVGSREQLLTALFGPPSAKAVRQIDKEVQSLSADACGWSLPGPVRQFVESQAECVFEYLPRCRDDDERLDMIRNAVASGFMLAVERYFSALREVPELRGLKAKESHRQEKSRDGKRAAKEQRAAEAQQMLDSGAEIADVAAHFGRSKGTIYKWLSQVAG